MYNVCTKVRTADSCRRYLEQPRQMSQHSDVTVSHNIATAHFATHTATEPRSDSQPPKCHTSIDTDEKTCPKAATNQKRVRVQN